MTTPVRRVAVDTRSLFLTFDDGPDPHTTPQVLDLLAKHGAHATFFLVAESAALHRDLVQLIQDRGHAIGNHSLDHRYGVFFQSQQHMLDWIKRSQEAFATMGCNDLVGFRPPAGVQTPPLHWALAQLGLPLVLWNHRFYDAVFPWRIARARASLARSQPGDIVLLHDRQKDSNRQAFLATLDEYLGAALAADFDLVALTPALAARH